MVHEKEKDMQTLDEWKAVLSKDLFELKQLEGRDAPTSMRRSTKHQEIASTAGLGRRKP
jgi:hypothetical protein